MTDLPTPHLTDVSAEPTTVDISDTLHFSAEGNIGILTLDRPCSNTYSLLLRSVTYCCRTVEGEDADAAFGGEAQSLGDLERGRL